MNSSTRIPCAQQRRFGWRSWRFAPARRSADRVAGAPEIIEAAARVFAERGFHGATTQDIADMLGIRQASLFYYFPRRRGRSSSSPQGGRGLLEAARAIAAGSGGAGEQLIRLSGRIFPRS